MSRIIPSIVVALLIGSSAFGQLGLVTNMQDTSIGLTNLVALQHGHQQGSSSQHLAILNDQCTEAPCPTWANQRFVGAIGQIGSACGECGVIELVQTLGGGAMQMQEVGSCVQPKAQLQNVTLMAGQTVGRAEGPGGGNALHTIVLGSGQNAGNAAGNMSENSNIMGIQTSSVSGQAGATGIVDSQMTVCTTQSQAVL